MKNARRVRGEDFLAMLRIVKKTVGIYSIFEHDEGGNEKVNFQRPQRGGFGGGFPFPAPLLYIISTYRLRKALRIILNCDHFSDQNTQLFDKPFETRFPWKPYYS